mmetsp:Transcript_4928/g.12995  ORF Transcript_4928/g.12995 Transcript_4928/m.12995 type:complete len:226 (+) Transcript_4928:95-772(+)
MATARPKSAPTRGAPSCRSTSRPYRRAAARCCRGCRCRWATWTTTSARSTCPPTRSSSGRRRTRSTACATSLGSSPSRVWAAPSRRKSMPSSWPRSRSSATAAPPEPRTPQQRRADDRPPRKSPTTPAGNRGRGGAQTRQSGAARRVPPKAWCLLATQIYSKAAVHTGRYVDIGEEGICVPQARVFVARGGGTASQAPDAAEEGGVLEWSGASTRPGRGENCRRR